MLAPTPAAFPLALAEENACVRVVAVRGSAAFAKRVADLGLNVGCEIAVRQREGGGALVIARGATRFALGAGMAQHILVAPVADGASTCEGNDSK